MNRVVLRERQSRSRGFTLVELLVVIAIIGVLIALLLPAVQAAREAARRTQCTNNLKQLSLGCLTHESAHKTLPAGGWCWYWVGEPDGGFDRTQPGGWTYNVLPYIEESQIRQIGSGMSNGSARKRALTSVMELAPVIFYCPSRPRPALTVTSSGYCNAWGAPATSNPPRSNKADYVASGGTYLPEGEHFEWPPRAATPQAAINDSSFKWPTEFTNACDGSTCIAKAMRMREISDGTTHTYLLGEKYINADFYENGFDGGDNQALFTGYDWDNIRWTVFPPLPDQPGRTELSFGSTHPSGLLMSFCDGSVRSVSYSIDIDTHQSLSTRAGSETIDESSL